ncbi:MAG: hypothetical protein AAGJ93_04970 [Bacteroidota bacterium]
MRFTPFTILLLLFSVQVAAQEQSLIDYLTTWDTLACIPAYSEATIQDTFFWKLADIDDAIELTRHPNPLIRTKVLLLLLNKTEPVDLPVVELLEDNLNDTAKITFCTTHNHFGEISYPIFRLYTSLLSDVPTEVVFHVPGKRYQADSIVKRQQDSLVLCQYFSNFKEREFIAFSALEYPSFFPLLRKQVINYKDRSALIYLSRFEQEEDIDLLLNYVEDAGIKSALVPLNFFSHPRLLNALEEYVDTSWNESHYMRAVAQYQNQQSLEILEAIYQRKRSGNRQEQNMGTLKFALENYFTGIYADLFLQLLSEQWVSVSQPLPDSLWTIHGDSLLQLFQQWDRSEIKWERRSAKAIYLQAKSYQATYYPEKLTDFIMGQIQPGSKYLDCATSIWHIWQTHDPAFVDPLFALLGREPLGKNRFIILKTLAHYEDDEITAQLNEWKANHPSLLPTVEDSIRGNRFFSNLEYYGKH